MSDKVVSFNSGKPLSEEKEAEERQISEDTQASKDLMLSSLDKIRKLVEEDRLSGFCLTAQNTEGSAHLTISAMNHSQMVATNYLAYSGALNALAEDMNDMASHGPHMTLEGDYFGIDPEGISHDDL